MTNWIEDGMDQLKTQELDGEIQAKEKEQAGRQKMIQVVEKLKGQLNPFSPQELLTDVKNLEWKSGKIIYQEYSGGIIQERPNFYSPDWWVAYGLVHSYPAKHTFIRSWDGGGGDRDTGHSKTWERIQPRYDCIIIGIGFREGVYFNAFTTSVFHYVGGHEIVYSELEDLRSNYVFRSDGKGVRGNISFRDELKSLIIEACKMKREKGVLPLL